MTSSTVSIVYFNMGETESVHTARTILGHYFAMAHGSSLNAQLCLDRVRDRFWKRFWSFTLIFLTLTSGALILPYMGKWQVVIPTLATCLLAAWAVVYTHNSLNDYMRPTDAERAVAKKWKKFLDIAYRLELTHTLADSIRNETDLSTQSLILSGNQFGNPYFREKIRGILRQLVDAHTKGVTEAEKDAEPDVAQRLHTRLLNWTRWAAEMLGIEYNRQEYR